MNTLSGFQEQTPDCFGKMWDSKATECTGGYDPCYVSPTGGKVRPTCDWFDQCKTKYLLSKSPAISNFIPATNLLRQPPKPFVPSYSPPYQQQQQPAPITPGRQQFQPPQHYVQQAPTVHIPPIEMMPVNYAMPAYLTVPEQRQTEESYWAPMFREVGRAIGKALGHAVANYFDRVPFGKR